MLEPFEQKSCMHGLALKLDVREEFFKTGGVSTVCIGFKRSQPIRNFLFLWAGRSIVELHD